MQRYVPIPGWLPAYERRSLLPDAVAGLSVWALLVPQSLAYATIVGVPVQYGLYTAFAALLVYPLFGTSRHLIVGPSATVGAVSAAVVAPLIGTAALGTDEAATYAAALALATAFVYLALGLLRMGWISTFLSKAVMSGFILGFAIGIVINQLHSLLGVPGSMAHMCSSSGEPSRRSRRRAARRSLSVPRRSRRCWSCATAFRSCHGR